MFQDWLRFDRRILHLFKLWRVKDIIKIYGWWSILFWPLEWVLGVGHLIGVGHILQLFFEYQARKLTPREIDLAESVYGDRINYSIVKINGKSRFSKRRRIAFVTGHIINYHSEELSKPLFIHELMHIYQYEQVGIVYIPRCLFAQASKQGYNFGRLEDHQDILNGTAAIRKLNYEQQAGFLEDMYRTSNHKHDENNLKLSFNRINFEF